jgi:hypothetical protein
MQLIAHQELTSAASSITFSSIPATFTDLYLVLSGRTDRNAAGDSVFASFNSVTTGFSSIFLQGSGSSASSGTEDRLIANVTGATQTANTFGSSAIYIPNYTSSANKSFSTDTVQENNATASAQTIIAGLWSNTSAITSITLSLATGPNFISGTSASLFGVLAGSDGIVSVS